MAITKRVSGSITEGTTKRLEFGNQGPFFNAWANSWGKPWANSWGFSWRNEQALIQIGITERVTAAITANNTLRVPASTGSITLDFQKRVAAFSFLESLLLEGDMSPGEIFLEGDATDGNDLLNLEGDAQGGVKANILKRVSGI